MGASTMVERNAGPASVLDGCLRFSSTTIQLRGLGPGLSTWRGETLGGTSFALLEAMTDLLASPSRLAWALLLGLGACGGAGNADLGAHPICTGEPGVRLAVRLVGGGPAPQGQAMQGENGWRLLMVNGSCHAWALDDAAGRLWQTDLTAQAEARLVEGLKVSTWGALVSTNLSCPDAPGLSLRLAELRRHGSPCGGGASWEDLGSAASLQISSVAEAGTIVDGDLRYLVIEEQVKNDTRAAVAWPLATSLASLATDGINYQRGNSLKASGAEAIKLAAIRTIPDTGGVYYGFTRVTDGDGKTYQLYIRDALPFEQENGLVPDGTF